MKIIPKVWGWEVVLVSTELYSCKLMVIKGKYRCSFHSHKLKDETFMLLMGNAELCIEGYISQMRPFEPARIYQQIKHSFACYSKFAILLEVATQDLPEDSYRDDESGKIS